MVGSFGTSVPDIVPNLLMLGAALIWALFITRRSKGNAVFAFPVIWGLGWLAFKALAQNPTSDAIGIAALIGLGIVAGSNFMFRQNQAENLTTHKA